MEAAAWLLAWTFVAPFLLAKKSKQEEKNNKDRQLPGEGGNQGGEKAEQKKKEKRRQTVRVFGADREIDIPQDKFPTDAELLRHLEGPSILPGCEHGWYDSVYRSGGDGDGNEKEERAAKLHYRRFLPRKLPPRAVIVYQHGISTHGGKALVLEEEWEEGKEGSGRRRRRKLNLSLMVEDFVVREGFALYAPDMYGHGYSEGVRFWIPDSWENNVKDLTNFVEGVVAKENTANVPVFLMGESYGGTLVLHAAKKYQDHPELLKPFGGIILTGPAIIGDLPPAPVTYLLKNVLAPRFPQWRPFFMPNPVSPERIWRDKEVLKIRTDRRSVEMGIDGSGMPFRLGTATNMIDAMEAVRESVIPKLEVPFCVVHGVEDVGVPIAGSDYLYGAAATPNDDREYHRIEGAYHDMLSDPTAEESMGYFVGFVKKQMAKNKQQ